MQNAYIVIRVKEIWFSTQDGTLHVGEAQSDPIVDPSMVILRDLIEAPGFPYRRYDFQREEYASWDRKDYLEYGRAVLGVLHYEETGRAFHSIHLSRLSTLGLGPTAKEIASRFNGIPNFRSEIGAARIPAERYANWSTSDFINYAMDLKIALGRKPIQADYIAAAEQDEGPSLFVIGQHVGTVTELNEQIGYPNIHSWKPAQYISWGLDVLAVNPTFNRYVARILSGKKLGPSVSSIVNKFGSISAFKGTVEQERELHIAQEAERLSTYRHQMETGKLPNGKKRKSESKILALGGKFKVVSAMVPRKEHSTKVFIATRSTDNFIEALRASDPSLTAGEIESTAVELGVFDDIWPMKRTLRELVVTPKELQQLRDREWKRRQRAA